MKLLNSGIGLAASLILPLWTRRVKHMVPELLSVHILLPRRAQLNHQVRQSSHALEGCMPYIWHPARLKSFTYMLEEKWFQYSQMTSPAPDGGSLRCQINGTFGLKYEDWTSELRAGREDDSTKGRQAEIKWAIQRAYLPTTSANHFPLWKVWVQLNLIDDRLYSRCV